MKLALDTRKTQDFIDITEIVREQVRQSGIQEGLAIVFIPHTTAGITDRKSVV